MSRDTSTAVGETEREQSKGKERESTYLLEETWDWTFTVGIQVKHEHTKYKLLPATVSQCTCVFTYKRRASLTLHQKYRWLLAKSVQWNTTRAQISTHIHNILIVTWWTDSTMAVWTNQDGWIEWGHKICWERERERGVMQWVYPH